MKNIFQKIEDFWKTGKRGNPIIIIFAIVIIICLFCRFSYILTKAPSTPTPTITSTPLPTKTPLPTNTSLPPTVTLTPLDALKANITTALGSGNRNIPHLNSVKLDNEDLTVDFAIDDNFTNNLIIYGAKKDVEAILKAIHDSGMSYGKVLVVGRVLMQDVYGNASEMQVIGLIYNKTTVDKINWQNFLIVNIYTIADGGFVNCAFRP